MEEKKKKKKRKKKRKKKKKKKEEKKEISSLTLSMRLSTAQFTTVQHNPLWRIYLAAMRCQADMTAQAELTRLCVDRECFAASDYGRRVQDSSRSKAQAGGHRSAKYVKLLPLLSLEDSSSP